MNSSTSAAISSAATIECEMAGIQNVNLGLRNILPVTFWLAAC